MARLLTYLWVAPVSLPAALLALVARAGGATLRPVEGVLEAAGGPLAPVLARIYPPMPIAAITLGHVVLAQSAAALAESRAHERVHVKQYERWGPFFPLLYVGASLVAVMRGGEAYRDNVFEREAYRIAPNAVPSRK